MKPLGYKCRGQCPGCACCKPSLEKRFKLLGKRRDRQQAKRQIERETC